MEIGQLRDLLPVRAGHPAFSADPSVVWTAIGPARGMLVDEADLLAGGAPFLLGGVVGYQREIQFRVWRHPELGAAQRCPG